MPLATTSGAIADIEEQLQRIWTDTLYDLGGVVQVETEAHNSAMTGKADALQAGLSALQGSQQRLSAARGNLQHVLHQQ